MSYAVKEIYYTLQGEGANTGRPAVFLRFAGCNLWSGREADRADAVCDFCDTDFVGTDGPGGGRFDTAADLAGALAAHSSFALAASRSYSSTRCSSRCYTATDSKWRSRPTARVQFLPGSIGSA